MMRAALVLALAACGAPRSAPEATPIGHAGFGLYPVDRECHRDWQCTFTTPLPITALGLWVGTSAVYVGGAIGQGDEPARAAIARWDGRAWRTWEVPGHSISSIDGRGDQVWAASEFGPRLHLVGDRWEPEGPAFDDDALVAVGRDDVFVAVPGRITHRGRAHAWPVALEIPAAPDGKPPQVFALAADDAGGAWAIVDDHGGNRIYTYDRDHERFVAVGEPEYLNLLAVAAHDDVVAVGSTREGDFAGIITRRWDGRAWSSQRLGLGMTMPLWAARRGRDLVVLGIVAVDSSDIGKPNHVAIVGTGGTRDLELPDSPHVVAVGADGGLWFTLGDGNELSFSEPTPTR